MSRIRVLDLAKELHIDTKTAIAKLGELGIQVKNHFNALSDLEADKLRAFHRSGKNPEKDSAKAGAKVIIRRRSASSSADTSDSVESSQDLDPKKLPEEAVTAEPQYVGVVPVQQESALSGSAFADSSPEIAVTTSNETSKVPVNSFSSPKVTSSDSHRVEPAQGESATDLNQAKETIEKSPVAESLAEFGRIADAPGVTTPSSQEPYVKETDSTSAKDSPSPACSAPRGATIVRPAPASSTGATVISRSPATTVPPATTGGATIIRQAPPPPSAGQGAIIMRRGEANPQGGSGVSTYRPDARGNISRPQGDRSTGGITPRPYHAGGAGGSSQGPGGFRRTDDGADMQMRGGFGAGRSGVGAPSGGGRVPFGARGPGGVGSAAGGGFGPRAGGTSGGFGPRPSIGTGIQVGIAPAEAGTGKEQNIRPREKEKELELRRRKIQEDEESRRAKLPAKGRNNADEGLDEFYDDEVLTGEGDAIPQVRTVIPNRKRGSAGRNRKEQKRQETQPMKASKRIVNFDESITVNDLAGEMSVKNSAVIKALMGLGMMAGVNQVLDIETATLVAQEFGFEVENKTVTIGDILNAQKTASNDSSQAEFMTRPPVITIMGHVDHGKTSLLDAIRSANVAQGEAGGITQHIGAYQIVYNDRKITFLDTPGHEAFTQMRARGAQVTDLVVLVVAADDGVMPQTLEAIAHAKAAKVPIVVAINKIDKEGANIERIQRELSGHGVTPEEWGGDSMFVPVSAKTRQGIPLLLESILLQSDVLDLKAPLEGLANGFVIEAKLDKARGPVATLLVTHGTMNVQNWVVAGTSSGRIRAMFDDKGNKLTEAGPSTPVEILGLSEVPSAGDTFNCVVNDSVAKEAVAFRIEKQRQKELAANQKSSLQDIMAMLAVADKDKPKELAIILKGDTQGSVEAIRSSLAKLDHEKVKTRVIHSGVGGITETDVSLAQASDAIIVGFNVRPDRVASQMAEKSGVSIKCYGVIYELIDEVQAAMVGRLAPIKSEKVQGHVEVRNLFSVPKIGVIAGSAVMDGKITRNSMARVVREGVVIYTGRISSLKRFKDDAKEVVQGFECGVGIENYNDLKVGDIIESFMIEETAATLD